MEKDPEAEQTLFLRGAAQLREGVQVCGTRSDVKGTDLNGKRDSTGRPVFCLATLPGGPGAPKPAHLRRASCTRLRRRVAVWDCHRPSV